MRVSFILLTFLLGHRPLARAQSPGTFTAIASMATARSSHTATLLQDGRVLIAGGVGGSNAILSSAEIYDPVQKTFTPAGNMTAARAYHTATLLPDGRVLIAGGDSTGSAELYDPSASVFIATGNLLMPQQGFNATLLNNGRVLVTGGSVGFFAPSGYLQIGGAEVYDPLTGLFTTAGAYAGILANNRVAADGFGSTSTLLPDGTVLVATEPASQVYDPVSATFSLRDPILITTQWGTVFEPSYIVGQTASLLLNGKVLLAGGEQEDTGRFNSTRLYDPASGLFVPAGSMIRARDNHAATLLLNGSVLMTGGESQNCDIHGASISCWFSGTESSAELYDPVAGNFTAAGNMTVPRELQTATLLNSGEVLITGGFAYGDIGISTASAELYHPALVSSPPALFFVAGDGQGQGAIWHAVTGQWASPQTPAVAGEILSMYVSGLAEGGAIPPQIAVGGRLADVLYFGAAPGYSGYYQVNLRVPSGVAPGPAVPVRVTYLSRSSNVVNIGVQ